MSEFHDVLKPTILVIDDTPANLTSMRAMLKDDYNVKLANSGERGLAIAFSDMSLDLILLDIMMPDMNGYEVCTRLKQAPQTRDIPVIFLTAKTETQDEQKGLELGAIDYIVKPVSPPIVLARVKNHLILKEATDFLRDKTAYLEAEVQRRTREIVAIQDVTIQIVTSLAETRDPDTGNHIRRTQSYVKVLAEKLKTHPRFTHTLTSYNIEMLHKSAPLHDIGKVGIPDNVLLKPSKFKPEEFEIMKKHTNLGFDAIKQAEHQLGTKMDFLQMAKEIALSHHERWDGSGYPQGLVGDNIPLSARLMAVADVYDALISHRIYKKGISHKKAVDIITQGKGTHFDPDIVEAFIEIQDEFNKIAIHYADGNDKLFPF